MTGRVNTGTKEEPILIRQALPIVPTWGDILNNASQSYRRGEPLHCDGGYIKTHHAQSMPEVLEAMRELEQRDAHLFIDLNVGGGSLGRHQDEVDVWYWQLQGETLWELGRLEACFHLYEGDLLYIPKNLEHKVTSLSPRSGVSFSKGEVLK
jgi:mannose-6-phosphate isomerase-like protein (cupin superfamily)